MRNKNLSILIAILALIATLLAVWHFLLRPVKKVPSSPSQPSPTPTEKFRSEEVKGEIIDNLPHETDGYSIQYLPNTDQFFVLIKKNPYLQYKNQTIAWFKKFGIKNPEEELPLFFTSTRWIAPE